MNAAPPELTLSHLPTLRHLAWMLCAPQLIQGKLVFKPDAHLPPRAWDTLRAWAENPALGPSVLTDPPHPRLGLYFERLYECLMTELLGWSLVAKNLQIKSGDGLRTLGELDLVLRNPETQALEHHEIAVKFYLGYQRQGELWWYGPNARDRLDLKTARLLEHQSLMLQRPETREALRERGIAPPERVRIFMPGYLFTPLNPSCPVASPVSATGPCTWTYLSGAGEMEAQAWVPLYKPHWLGPWLQVRAPDPAGCRAALAQIGQSGRPGLFARLEQDRHTGLWLEAERRFVVPSNWPDK